MVDLQGRIRYLSPSAQMLIQTNPAHLIDETLPSLCHADDAGKMSAWFKRLQRSDERELCEVRLGRAMHWRRIKLSGIRIKEDEYHEVIVISAHDVTLEVEAARALKASEQRYHGAFDYSPIGKALLDETGEVAESNRALAEMLDCWVSELIGSNLFEHFAQSGAQQLRHDAAELLAGRESVCERELQLQRHGQAAQWLLLNMAPIWTESGALEHFIVQLQDITARRQAEHSLRESNADLLRSNEELKRFAFIASHDLREPLRGIGGSIQLIARRYRDALGEEGQELAQQGVAGVKRLQALLDELVTYAEQMRGGEFSRQTVAVTTLIAELEQELAPRLEQTQGRISYANLPSILGDPEQLRQIFRQLLENALIFCAPARPPRVEVSARWTRGMWEFCVADNGIGIAAEHQEQIFEVFRRLNPDTPGTGMGLATVRKMIERHGGKIWVDSAVDQGARFYFSLPPE